MKKIVLAFAVLVMLVPAKVPYPLLFHMPRHNRVPALCRDCRIIRDLYPGRNA